MRLNETLTLLAFTLGGRGGARASVKLKVPVGKDSLLRAARARMGDPAISQPPVKVLGVDDFAFRKGVSYGTILIDLERRKPIDLLSDRTAATLAAWLKAHPEVDTVSRDRSTVYAEAARTGAPQAIQVADRWHLLKNLGDLIERFFVQNHRLLIETARQIRDEHRAAEPEIALLNDSANKLRPVPLRRQQLFDEIKKLQANGKSIHGIVRELKISRNTVRRYARCNSVPRHHTGAGRPSSVAAFAEYLEQRWRMGEHNAFRLWQEIRENGFSGEVYAVRRFVHEWRKTPVGKINYPISSRGMSPRQATKLLLYPTQIKNENEQNYLRKLCQISPAVERLGQLGRNFQQMIREKRLDLFDKWIIDVQSSEISELKNWANGLLADEEAVRNAFSSPWSNGQVEGQVNRLKTIKRQMYGRANFDLLKARVLYQS